MWPFRLKRRKNLISLFNNAPIHAPNELNKHGFWIEERTLGSGLVLSHPKVHTCSVSLALPSRIDHFLLVSEAQVTPLPVRLSHSVIPLRVASIFSSFRPSVHQSRLVTGARSCSPCLTAIQSLVAYATGRASHTLSHIHTPSGNAIPYNAHASQEDRL